jgi:hypothetical protein
MRSSGQKYWLSQTPNCALSNVSMVNQSGWAG